jgi:hypothetical protein
MCRLLIRVLGAVEQKKEKERIMPRKTKEPVVVIQTVPGEGIFVLMDGQRIAERGAGEWIPLEPGVAVYSSPDQSSITVEIRRVRVH